MFGLELAGRRFNIEAAWPETETLCRDYLAPPDPQAPVVSVTAAERQAEAGDGSWPESCLESQAILRKLCRLLLEEDVVLFHSSAVTLDGRGVLLTGPSGVGKSTQARLWRQRFPDRITNINDDKPLLHVGEEITVYGSPWAGKEGLQTNTSAPVQAILVLEQAGEDSLERLTAHEAFPLVLDQTYRPGDAAGLCRTLELAERLSRLPVWRLRCTPRPEAAELAVGLLTKGNDHEAEGRLSSP